MTIIVFILVNTLFIVSLNLITFPIKGLSNIANLLFTNNLVFEFAYILMDGIINTFFFKWTILIPNRFSSLAIQKILHIRMFYVLRYYFYN